jgi:RNA polymerase sigma factor (sigma-70 family)
MLSLMSSPRRVIFTFGMGFGTMTPPPAENFAARVFLGPALRTQPDRRLVDLVRDGYDAAFEEIVRRYRHPLDRFAAAIVGGRSEDVTQDAFSKALLALRGSEAEIELRPWLYRIVRNTALNDLRGRAPAAVELSDDLPGSPGAAAEAETREELADLMERLRALPEPQRAAIVMRELEGLSHEEIAAALGVSGGAARQAIYRARTTLRDGFGLLIPLPLLRMLAEGGGEAAAAGGAIAAGAGASAAGGATLTGIGAGAAKVGVAVLIAGSVGAGVVVEQRGGDNGRGPEAAQAAPSSLGAEGRGQSSGSGASGGSGSGGSAEERSGGGDGSSGRGGDDDDRRENRRDDRRGEDRDDDDGRDDGRGRGRGRGRSGDDDSDRSGSSGRSGSGSSESSGDDDDFDDEDRSGSSGSGSSGSGSSGSGSGSSGSGSSGSGSSGSSGGEVEPVEEPEPEEIEPVEEPEIDDDNSGSGSDSSGSDDFDED